MTPVSTSAFVVKPLVTAAVTFAIDQFLFSYSNLKISAIFAASSGVGVFLGMMVGSSIFDLSHSLPVFLGNGKKLLERVAEIGFGAGRAY